MHDGPELEHFCMGAAAPKAARVRGTAGACKAAWLAHAACKSYARCRGRYTASLGDRQPHGHKSSCTQHRDCGRPFWIAAPCSCQFMFEPGGITSISNTASTQKPTNLSILVGQSLPDGGHKVSA